MNVLVVDAGSSSLRAILFDGAGRVRASRQVRYRMERRGAVVEQRPESFADALRAAVAGVVGDARKGLTSVADEPCEGGATLERLSPGSGLAGSGYAAIDLVALTAQRSSVTALDCSGSPLIPFIMWRDERNAALCRALAVHDARVMELSGAPVSTVFSGGKIAWVRRELPEVYARTATFANVAMYLLLVMTGEAGSCGGERGSGPLGGCVSDEYVSGSSVSGGHISGGRVSGGYKHIPCDHTYGSRTNLMNIDTLTWDDELLALFGVEREKLGELVAPGSLAGHVSHSFAEATGLAAGIPVVSAGGDQQCAMVGMGAFAPGVVSVVTGTGAFASVSYDGAETPQALGTRESAGWPAGTLIRSASCLAGCHLLETTPIPCCSRLDSYLAEHGLTINAIPHLARTLDAPEGRELRALLDDVFRQVREGLDQLARHTPITEARISGGLTQTHAFNQLQADAYGLPVLRCLDHESTARGALISALVGQGVYPSPEEAWRAVCGHLAWERIEPRM